MSPETSPNRTGPESPSFAPIASHRGGRERGIDALGVQHSVNTEPLRQVLPAVIRGEGHRIINAGAVKEAEEISDLPIEFEHVEAHLLPLGAVGVADIVGRRQADAEHVRRASLS